MKLLLESSRGSRPPISTFCLDVDGVLTDGSFVYSSFGKVAKVFGAEDADALAILRSKVEVRFLTADRRGFKISRARIVRDMGFPLDLVPSRDRLAWIKERYVLSEVAYMGDSFMDAQILSEVGLAICPQNANQSAKKRADFVTLARGGSGAVAEAVFFLASYLGLENLGFPDG